MGGRHKGDMEGGRMSENNKKRVPKRQEKNDNTNNTDIMDNTIDRNKRQM